MKMTKLRKERLRLKLQESRSRLMETHPFFAILLMYLRFVAVDNIRTISTNGKCIFFHADFVAKLNPKELDFLLCHQIMHILRRDIWRDHALTGDEFHRACDIYNNDQLIRIGWNVSSFSHLGKLQYRVPIYDVEVHELTPYDIYELLPFKLKALDERTRRRYMTDSDFYWNYKYRNDIDGIVILDIPEMTKYTDGFAPENEAEMQEFWENQAGKAFTIMKGMGKQAGALPGGVKRELEKSKKRVVDWRKILDEFLQEEITDYSFTPPDRRYTDAGFFLPDYNEKDYIPKDILFMADTSGSVSREELGRVFSEIEGAIEQFGGKLKGKLGFFDCEVTEPVDFACVEDIGAIAPYGGGGTSFDIIFEYVREHINDFLPAMIVIFTDGYANFPEEKETMNIPVLWLISNEEITPPWGTVGRVI